MAFARLITLVACCVIASARAADAAEATLLRLFLIDGTAVVSYGEFARLDDRVIFSMPLGGTADNPRLYVVSVPASRIDWARTDRYTTSARYQWYAASRGEADFARMSTDVARVLNEVAVSKDRRRALTLAEEARRTLASWPAEHFGYRQADVREIVGLLEESISSRRASLGISEFSLDLVATPPESGVVLEPLLGMPGVREQLDQAFRLVAITDRVRDRVALLHAALAVLDDPASGLTAAAAATLRISIAGEIREETAIDARYAAMSRRMMAAATRAAESARVNDVQRVLAQIGREDRRLGGHRPDEVRALVTSVQGRLDAARRLQLERDRWAIRRGLYREWQRSAGVQLMRLVKERAALEAIRDVSGPPASTVAAVRGRLAGGADRLQRIGVAVPEDLRAPHDLLVSAWRFADTALTARYSAAASANVSTAWEASSAAAAALLMIDRAQLEIRTLLEPPKLR